MLSGIETFGCTEPAYKTPPKPFIEVQPPTVSVSVYVYLFRILDSETLKTGFTNKFYFAKVYMSYWSSYKN